MFSSCFPVLLDPGSLSRIPERLRRKMGWIV